jgi:hypothetical protein
MDGCDSADSAQRHVAWMRSAGGQLLCSDCLEIYQAGRFLSVFCSEIIEKNLEKCLLLSFMSEITAWLFIYYYTYMYYCYFFETMKHSVAPAASILTTDLIIGRCLPRWWQHRDDENYIKIVGGH